MAQRSSYTRTNAIRFVSFLNFLIEESKKDKPQELYLRLTDFGNVKMVSLNNRFTDAFLWLRHNNIGDDNKGSNNKPYTTQDYELLHSMMVKRIEKDGIRLNVIPNLSRAIRAGAPLEADVWKAKITHFFDSSSEPLLVLNNVSLTQEGVDWIHSICGGLGAEYHVEGDQVTVLKKS